MKRVLIFTILSIGGYFLSQWIETIAKQQVQHYSSKSNQIDSFFNQFKTVLTDKTGHVKHSIQGTKLIHIQNSNALISKPLLKVHDNDEIKWNVTSKNAEIKDKQTNIIFKTNVIVLNSQDIDDKMIITTEELEFITDEKIMKTDRRISLTTAKSYTTAIGMIAHTEKQEILLMEKVRSTYEN